ncbi:MAG: LPS assembly lipoprotein LptE [Candidatus Rokuibacteriota bacterium]
MRTGPGRVGTGAVVIAALLVAVGCGYSFRGTLPDHIQSIAVPVFTNRTREPAVENVITRAVVEAFSTNGRLRVVGPERADSLLEGEITGYELVSLAFDPSAAVRRYRLVVTLNLRYRDLRERTLVFARSGFQERADFQVGAAVSQTLVQEDAALRTAAVEIGRAVVALTLDRF